MSLDDLTMLHREAPELFRTINFPYNWNEDFSIVPIRDPERYWLEPTWMGDFEFPDNHENKDWELLESMAELISLDEPIFPFFPGTTLELLSGNFGGGPQPTPTPGGVVSTENLAFYLPFHHFFPDWWGIYILFDGLIWLRNEIYRRSSGRLSGQQSLQAARLFLFHHEAFHHKTECFATRLELTHRNPYYVGPFEAVYSRTVLSSSCLEESLAEATALNAVWEKCGKDKILRDALHTHVAAGLPGYREGADLCDALTFKDARCRFAEENQRECLPSVPSKHPSVWGSAPHLFDGIANIKSRVNYILPHGSPLTARLPFRPCVTPTQLIRKLKNLVGLVFIRQKGSHQVWRTPTGLQTTIPDHPRDLGRGLLKQILKDVGLNMSIDEFLRA